MHPVAARALGRVHRRVGVAEQLVRVAGAGLRDGDADARRQRHRDAVGGEGPGEGALQPEGQGRGLRDVAVRAPARGTGRCPAGRRRRRAHLLRPAGAATWRSSWSPTLVAERVVDRLEAVEVQDEQRPRRRRPSAGPSASASAIRSSSGAAVGQPGEVVVPGPPGQHLLAAHPLGDVGVGDDHPAEASTREACRRNQTVVLAPSRGVVVVEGRRRGPGRRLEEPVMPAAIASAWSAGRAPGRMRSR